MNTSAITRLWRRTLMSIGAGRLTQVDDSRSAQLMQLQLGQDELKDDTPRLAEYGFVSNPPIGSDAVVLFIAGERTNGVVVATNNQTVRMTGLATGEVAIHDDKGRFVLLGAAGIHVQGNADPILVETTGPITALAGGDIDATSTGGGVNVTAAGAIKLVGDSIELHASSVTVQASSMAITAETQVTGSMGVAGITTLVGDTSIAGALQNNGHDIGDSHEHGPGSLHAGTTAITGNTGVVSP